MKVSSITVKYDTGQLDVADGDKAGQIFAWWQFCENFVVQHGIAIYKGSRLRRIDCITQADEAKSLPAAEEVEVTP